MASAAWWRALVAEYHFLPHQLRMLTAAAEAWDPKEQPRARIEADGLTFTSKRRISDATATRMLQISRRDHVAAEARSLRHAAMMANWPWCQGDSGVTNRER